MKIHTTIGLYPNGQFKVNGVLPEHLDEHVRYNIANRPGRALFVDEKCLHPGYGISIKALEEFAEQSCNLRMDYNSEFYV